MATTGAVGIDSPSNRLDPFHRVPRGILTAFEVFKPRPELRRISQGDTFVIAIDGVDELQDPATEIKASIILPVSSLRAVDCAMSKHPDVFIGGGAIQVLKQSINDRITRNVITPIVEQTDHRVLSKAGIPARINRQGVNARLEIEFDGKHTRTIDRGLVGDERIGENRHCVAAVSFASTKS